MAAVPSNEKMYAISYIMDSGREKHQGLFKSLEAVGQFLTGQTDIQENNWNYNIEAYMVVPDEDVGTDLHVGDHYLGPVRRPVVRYSYTDNVIYDNNKVPVWSKEGIDFAFLKQKMDEFEAKKKRFHTLHDEIIKLWKLEARLTDKLSRSDVFGSVSYVSIAFNNRLSLWRGYNATWISCKRFMMGRRCAWALLRPRRLLERLMNKGLYRWR